MYVGWLTHFLSLNSSPLRHWPQVLLDSFFSIGMAVDANILLFWENERRIAPRSQSNQRTFMKAPSRMAFYLAIQTFRNTWLSFCSGFGGTAAVKGFCPHTRPECSLLVRSQPIPLSRTFLFALLVRARSDASKLCLVQGINKNNYQSSKTKAKTTTMFVVKCQKFFLSHSALLIVVSVIAMLCLV